MTIAEIRGLAQSRGINADNLFKTELIRSIQIEERNFDCYGSAYDGVCDQSGCCWRVDCFEAARNGKKI